MAAQHGDYTLTLRALSHYDPNDAVSHVGLCAQLPGEAFAAWLEHYRARLQKDGRGLDERRAQMLARNPKYILRNYLAQQAIDAAEQGDYAEIETLHRVLQRPFDEQPEYERYAAPPPEWGKQLEISCSS